MSKRMLVNAAQEGEVRVAIVEDQVLEDLSIAVDGTEMQRGNIYKGIVVTVETGLQAAFVDFGEDRNGFITFNDIHPKYYNVKQTKTTGRPKIQDALKPGAELLIQVHKEAVGNKGAALTTDITMPGRYLVFTPLSSTTGVSRKIEDEKSRKRLKDVVGTFDIPEGGGVIVRTAGQDEEPKALADDFQRLLRLWGHIRAGFETTERTKVVHREPDVIIRTIRDYLKLDVEELIVDDATVFNRLTEYFGNDAPDIVERLKLYRGKMPIFSNYGLERQLAHISSHNVPLPSGGSIVINPTEALTAIDVNSGKSRGQDNQEIMAYQTNLEAATAVARQLRLRDVGGLVVVDFIDMMEAKHRRGVTKQLSEAMTKDKARVELGRISKFGLLELSRQRIKARLMMSSHLVCPHCEGSGYIMTTDFQAMSMLRRLQELAVSAPRKAKIIGRLPASTALRLLNGHRSSIADLEEKFEVEILLIPDADAAGTKDAFEITTGSAEDSNATDAHKRERKSRERRSRHSSNRPQQKSTDTAEPKEEEEATPAKSTSGTNSSRNRNSQSNKSEGSRRRNEPKDNRGHTNEAPTEQPPKSQDTVTEQPQDDGAASARRAAARERIKARRAQRSGSGQTQTTESNESPKAESNESPKAVSNESNKAESKPERPRRSRRPRRESHGNRAETPQQTDAPQAPQAPQAAQAAQAAPPAESKADALKAATRRATKRLRDAQSQRNSSDDKALSTKPARANSSASESKPAAKPARSSKPVSLKNRLKSKLSQQPKTDSSTEVLNRESPQEKPASKKPVTKSSSTAALLKAKLKAKTSAKANASAEKPVSTKSRAPRTKSASSVAGKPSGARVQTELTGATGTEAKKPARATRSRKTETKEAPAQPTAAEAKTTRTRKAASADTAQEPKAKPAVKKPAVKRVRTAAKPAAGKVSKSSVDTEASPSKQKVTRSRSTATKGVTSKAAPSSSQAKAPAKAKAPVKKTPAKTAVGTEKPPARNPVAKAPAKAKPTASRTAKAPAKDKPAAAKKPTASRAKKTAESADTKPKATRSRTPRKTAAAKPTT